MRLVIVIALLAGCGGYSQKDVDHLETGVGEANTRRMAHALAGALSSHDLKEVATPVGEPVTRLRFDGGATIDLGADPYGQLGMTAAEQVGNEVRDDGSDGDDVLVIAGQCGGGCECLESTDYHFAADDAGRLYLVRLRVDWQARNIHRSGSCGYGCGQPMPTEPAQIYRLTPGFGGFVDGKVVQEHVEVTCDHMIPAP